MSNKEQIGKLVDKVASRARWLAFEEVQLMLQEMRDYNRGWNDAAGDELQVALDYLDRIMSSEHVYSGTIMDKLEEEA